MNRETIIILLLVVLVIIYLSLGKKEKFDFLSYQSIPYPSNIDYQDDLNMVSGYDSGTRGYYNPYYARKIAQDLDTN